MTYNEFKSQWSTMCAIYNQRPLDSVFEAVYPIFKELPVEMLAEALNRHIQSSNFMPKPAEIFGYIKQKAGVTENNLKNEAYKFYDAYLVNITSADAVIENKKMAYAFDACFGSIENFFNRPSSSYQESKDREAFSDAVIYSKDLKLEHVPQVFKGLRPYSKSISVAFFGSCFENCRRLALEHYSETGEDKIYRIDLPIPAERQLEEKEIPMTPAQKQKNLIFMNKVLSALTSKNLNSLDLSKMR